jgi:signal transduction histidine kinase
LPGSGVRLPIMSPTLAMRLRRLSPQVVDIAVAVVVAIPVLASSFTSAQAKDQPALGLLGLLVVAPLVVRRRWPVASLAAILAAGAAIPGAGTFLLAALVALYTIACTQRPRVIAVATLATALAALVHRALWEQGAEAGDLVTPLVAGGVAVSIGLYVASHRSRVEFLSERADRLDRERELLAQRAVAEERVRIAQELHDVVAHNVSLIVVQAKALAATAKAPEITVAMDGIAELGRQAMSDMHRTLKLLRGGDGAAELAPQPTLANVGHLVEHARSAGIDVDFVVSGTPPALPTGMDLSAYRIVQEALTNVLKHAGPAKTRVSIEYAGDLLTLTVSNELDAAGDHVPVTNGSGAGLIGMRERVALFGGSLVVDTDDRHVFSVKATLPNTPETA